MKDPIINEFGETCHDTGLVQKDLTKLKCLPEMWLVQGMRFGQWIGYANRFHPKREAVEAEAEKLRADLPASEGWEFHVGRYVLAAVEES